MFATAVTLAIMGIAIMALADLAKHDGAKIVNALQGRSRMTEPKSDRPIMVRFSSRQTASAPAWQAELRAAA